MIKFNKFDKIIAIAFFILLVAGSIFFYRPNINISQAQKNNDQDSDYDGLTDRVESEIYHTNYSQSDTDGDKYLDSAEVLIGSDPLNPNDPKKYLVDATTLGASQATNTGNIIKKSSQPWYVARAAGLVAYFLMFLVIMLGTGMTTSYIYRYINPVKAWLIHKYLSLALGVTLLTHIIALSLDKFINFSWLDILVPFVSRYKTLFLSAGILGFYVLIIVIFTSLFFRLKYKKTWRGIHYAVYPLFIFSLFHGVFIGTDTLAVGAQILYYITGLIFFSLVFYRFIIRYFKFRV